MNLQTLDLNLSKSRIDNDGIFMISKAFEKLEIINKQSLDFDFIEVEGRFFIKIHQLQYRKDEKIIFSSYIQQNK
ncbi:hypothetical protein TTHERM_00105380 (macronuclear) [Tetrahymena thermophila SB210]|uniref:Uncharacterized protein n=1 Tax=Tetrahymena thermophila (strain SB210) TaxID=312017 RepID=Q234G0_TETTS|nr:hypothetical protein TTHERM_00105380 [Tetrahymena thermophila SB210]EAR92043.1 hypothetical protein TTHERM_00105380 [Tetrahymena thermophila SB210]|eukprot:XP_001012288.1 hypothetical protein TTHERM_00105380 [Tetrahymena thermophila SB210]